MELEEWLAKNDLDIKPVLDGRIKRFSIGDNKETGWYIGSSSLLPSGKEIVTLTVSDWRTDDRLHYRSGGFNNGDLEHWKKQTEKHAKEIEKEKEEKWRGAAIEAERIWNAGQEADENHPYCRRKRINKTVVGNIKQLEGRLLIPLYQTKGVICGLQFISEGGEKRFLPGTKKMGAFFAFYGEHSKKIAICEGFATASSIYEATGITTFTAFDCGNLGRVGRKVRESYPDGEIWICGDDDRFKEKNAGRECAELAAKECGGRALFPGFDLHCGPLTLEALKPTDWNDLHCMKGIDEVKRQIEEAIGPIHEKTGSGEADERPKAQPKDNEANPGIQHGSGEGSQGANNAGEDKGTGGEEVDLSARDKFRHLLKNLISGKTFSDEEKDKVVFDKQEMKIAKEILKRVFFVNDSPFCLARNFLEEDGFIDDKKTVSLKYYRHDFYRYRTNHYQVLDDEWIIDRINRWLIRSDWKKLAGTDKVSKILNVLKIKPVYIGSQIELPVKHIEDGSEFGEWEQAKNIVPIENGLLDVKEEKLIPHSQEYFFNYTLPFNYDKEAKCPTFEKICADIFSSPEEILIWEEVMGIHIYNPFLIEKMFILLGEGANGKSVMTTVLGCLLGNKNTSAVPIECFSPNNFAFIETLGKLANIVADMKDVSAIDEGALKKFISREEIHFNRKNKPVIKAKPTAFLTVCTNVLPKFTDKTDGIWRRILLLDFKKQIPLQDRNPLYRDPDFWVRSGELPGIFNRALAGAKRVERRGYVLETDDTRESLEDYRTDLNYTAQFAKDYLEFDRYARIPSHPVYTAYKNMVVANGGKICASKTFFHQLKSEGKKHGHLVELTKKAERKDNYIGKFLLGAKLNESGELLSIQNDPPNRYS